MCALINVDWPGGSLSSITSTRRRLVEFTDRSYYLCDQRSDEYEEYVVDEERGEENGADLEARQAKDLQHVDAENEYINGCKEMNSDQS